MSSERERKFDPRGSPEFKRSRSPPASYRQADPKNDLSVVKIRGLPYQTTAMEVCRFFKDCEIVGGANGIYFPLNERGLPTGEAFVEMESAKDIDKALERHKDCIGERYIEVFESSMSVLEKVKKTSSEGRVMGKDEGKDRDRWFRGVDRFLDRDRGFRGERDRDRGNGNYKDRGFSRGREVSSYCVRLRGLPWEAKKDDVADFLSRCEIVGGNAGIIINMDDRGRAAGDAYVELETRDDMETAISNHKREMGSRYIEVFEANRLDVEKAKARTGRSWGDSMGFGRRNRDRGGSKGYTVQLRGLPYRATEREIADWLSEAADPVDVIIGIDRGRPNGKAEAVFSSDRDARRVAQNMHKKDLGSRYIECFYDEQD